MPIFSITNKSTKKEQSHRITKDSIIIGRMPSNDIVLDGKSVSRKHAEISRLRGEYFVADLESGNGTFLNGSKLKPHEKTPLKADDKISIEEFEIRFRLLQNEENPFPDEQTDSDIIEIKMIKKVLSAIKTDQDPSLEVMGPPCEGKRVFMTDDMQELFMGREPGCHLVIDSSMVSRRHAVLQRKWGGVVIKDLDSKNGTFFGKEKIGEKSLEDGDVFLLGDVPVKFRNPQQLDLDAISKEYQKDESLISSKSPKPSSLDASLSPLRKEGEKSGKIVVEEKPKEEKRGASKFVSDAAAAEPSAKPESKEEPKPEPTPPATEPEENPVPSAQERNDILSLINKLSSTEKILIFVGLGIIVGALVVISILLG